MASAESEVKAVYPGARVVRTTFGLAIAIDEESGIRLGEGRAYYEEAAWLEAAGELPGE